MSKNKNKAKSAHAQSNHGQRPVSREVEKAAPTAALAAEPPAAPQANAGLRKDQQRALWAYGRAEARAGRGNGLPGDATALKDYENSVQTFASAILRTGLAVAVSVLERDAKRDAPQNLLKDLAGLVLPGLGTGAQPLSWQTWPGSVRNISSLSDYMLATRELLQRAQWLRRACRATRAMIEAEKADEAAEGATPDA